MLFVFTVDKSGSAGKRTFLLETVRINYPEEPVVEVTPHCSPETRFLKSALLAPFMHSAGNNLTAFFVTIFQRHEDDTDDSGYGHTAVWPLVDFDVKVYFWLQTESCLTFPLQSFTVVRKTDYHRHKIRLHESEAVNWGSVSAAFRAQALLSNAKSSVLMASPEDQLNRSGVIARITLKVAASTQA